MEINTMNYALCRKLKNAGFPQEKSPTYYVNDKSQIENCDSRWGGCI